MDINQGMGHDSYGPEERKPRVFSLPVILLIVVLVLLIGIFASLALGGAKGGEVTPPNKGGVATAPIEETNDDEADDVTDTEGHDDNESAGAPQQAWTVFEEFVAAWTSDDPRKRKVVFAATATDELAEGLEETTPDKVITANRTRVEVDGSSEYAAGFVMWFENVENPIYVTLEANPESTYGWLVSDIQKRGT